MRPSLKARVASSKAAISSICAREAVLISAGVEHPINKRTRLSGKPNFPICAIILFVFISLGRVRKTEKPRQYCKRDPPDEKRMPAGPQEVGRDSQPPWRR